MRPPASESKTVEQLRAGIDSAGESKAPALDPAAVPLGADDEAGGVPPAPPAVGQAYHDEVSPSARERLKPQTNDAMPLQLPGAGGWSIAVILLVGLLASAYLCLVVLS